MQLEISIIKDKAFPLAGTLLFVLFVVMLPRYTDTAKTWYVLLILTGFFYLIFNIGQVRETSTAERIFLSVVILNFLWIAFCFYVNGQPGRGSSFLWGRHFYFTFLIPLFFLFRKIEISDWVILIALVTSVAVSLIDILIDMSQGINYRHQGMNPNGFGPIQLCLSGMLLFYFLERPLKSLRWLSLAGALLGLSSIVFSLSRNTWMTTIVISILFVFYLTRSVAMWKKLGIVLCLILVLSSSYILPIVKNRVDPGVTNLAAYFATDDYLHESRLTSLGVRFELWKTGWNIFLENPVFGAGVGGFTVLAKEHSERYQVNEIVHKFKYVHNQYIATLATRGIPGLVLLLAVFTLPIYLAISNKTDSRQLDVAQLSIVLICLNYLVGCIWEDHFETKPATMFVSAMLPLWLARISNHNKMQKTVSD
ncbi:MAG: O-antigen ligase family protein [Gammaproteobacteria bacterium]|nr:O-antigen ligase family protein [Gammaproteobacteria bacterium]